MQVQSNAKAPAPIFGKDGPAPPRPVGTPKPAPRIPPKSPPPVFVPETPEDEPPQAAPQEPAQAAPQEAPQEPQQEALKEPLLPATSPTSVGQPTLDAAPASATQSAPHPADDDAAAGTPPQPSQSSSPGDWPD